MSLQEITELMDLRGWTPTDLASEIGLSEAAVKRWFGLNRKPSGSAAKLMRLLLRQARGEIRIVEVSEEETVAP